MKKKVLFTPFAAALLVLGTGLPASAGSVTFNFNSLSSGLGPSSIQTYMNAQLALASPGLGLTVSSPTGAITNRSYNGDGHVVGQGFNLDGSPNRDSLTLGTSENGVYNGDFTCTTSGCSGPLDTFIKNNSPATQWTFAFMGGMIIDSVKFDYEIFPDASGNVPDMTFRTNLGEVFHYYGVTPPAPNGNNSPVSLIETSKQLIGNTGILTGPMISGANSLTFIDWPVTIGIDNLTITYHTNGVAPVPEPASMLLLGSGLAAAYARRKKRQGTV